MRGAATLVVVATPVWALLINGFAYEGLDARLAALLGADGFGVAAKSMGMPPYLFMGAVMIAAPVVAVRSRRSVSRVSGGLRPVAGDMA